MEELLVRVGQNLVGRIHGPMNLRLILQPLVALFFATRAGLRDARSGESPYLWAIFTTDHRRRELLRQGWRDVGKAFMMAVAVDVVYQIITLHWIYPGETVLVAGALALLPYFVFRGLATRLFRSR
jgi:hypothetical protein